ncbi:MAG: metal-dependent hydrolase [Ectothiorhodospiraceae bacterium]|nr:metal-dependent hydrolase [Ectothiorhodospiraceae bacterium]
MDSVTQALLGAAVGQATLGRTIGRRALLWGAMCGTLPDLDVLVPFADPVADFTYHRSASHSVLVLTALTPVVAWLATRVHPDTRDQHRRWLAMVWLAFVTHILLDCFTVYGTQILWPLSSYPVGWSTVFIIDPAYTVPLALGVLCALVAGARARVGRVANAVGLGLGCAYLAWTVGAKAYVERAVRAGLAAQGLPSEHVLTTPAPFNTLLWRFVAMDDDGYYEGYRSVLDRDAEIHANRYPSRADLVAPLAGHWPVERLRWFTKGFYAVTLEDEAVVMSDLRMGVEPDYVFRFAVGAVGNPHPRPVPAARVAPTRDLSRLEWLWARIWRQMPEPARR